MAATSFTPISLYYSSTASNVPTAGNLVAGELAINTADGKLFYKDSSGVVQVIGTKGGVGSSTTTQVLYNSSGLVVGSANMTFNGTTFTLANDASISGLTVGKGGGTGNNTVFGYQALASNVSGETTAVGYQAAYSNTTGGAVEAFGYRALYANTTGGFNVAVGQAALRNNTTASNNTAVGYQAGYSNTTGAGVTAIGYQAGNANTTASYSTFVGQQAGLNTTGTYNTFLGTLAGYLVTSGTKNTVIGGFPGNQGGLDIRTASNYIVLSDGDGNPRGYFDGSGNLIVGSTVSDIIGSGANGLSYRASIGNLSVLAASASALAVGRATTTGAMVYFYYNAVAKGSISTDGSNVAYNTSSDYRLKENIVDLPNALTVISQLKPRQFDWKETKETTTGFIAHELSEVMPQAVTGEKDALDAEGNPVYQGIDTSFLVATLTAAIQELNAKVDAQAVEIASLKAK